MQKNSKANRSALPTGRPCASALLIGTLTACGNLDYQPSVQKEYLVTVTDTVLNCGGGGPNPIPKDITIEVLFHQMPSGAWCPYDVNALCPTAFKGKHIVWKAIRDDGAEWEDFDTRFDVYFSPINGHSIAFNNNGLAQGSVDAKAPSGVYKYTVWDAPQGNTASKCEPYDPNYFVH
jgi:hypothetical protein